MGVLAITHKYLFDFNQITAGAQALKLVHFNCLQHCRTYYHKAAKVTELPPGKNLARMAIDEYIGKVYAVERHIKELREEREKSGTTLPLEVVLKILQERSEPVMAAFKGWVEKLLPGVPPTSALGKARSLRSRQWARAICLLALSLRRVTQGAHCGHARSVAPLERETRS